MGYFPLFIQEVVIINIQQSASGHTFHSKYEPAFLQAYTQVQEKLEGGRNYVWYWKDTQLLCLIGIIIRA